MVSTMSLPHGPEICSAFKGAEVEPVIGEIDTAVGVRNF